MGDLAGQALGAKHRGQIGSVQLDKVEGQHVGRISLVYRAPPACPGNIASVGGRLAGEAEVQVIVGQQDPAGGRRNLWLGPAEPCPVGNGERSGEHRPHAHRRLLRAAQGRNERSRIRSVPGVVPQRCLAKRGAATVQDHHPVLLARD
jgi:hypothetical protein